MRSSTVVTLSSTSSDGSSGSTWSMSPGAGVASFGLDKNGRLGTAARRGSNSNSSRSPYLSDSDDNAAAGGGGGLDLASRQPSLRSARSNTSAERTGWHPNDRLRALRRDYLNSVLSWDEL